MLKNYEHYMWLAAGRKGSKGVSMGKNDGTEFVDSVFGLLREQRSSER